MAVMSRAVTVTTTATRLDSDTDKPTGASVAFYNNSASTVYVGGSDVTTANGTPVPTATWSPTFTNVLPGDTVYGIVGSGTAEVRVLEVGV